MRRRRLLLSLAAAAAMLSGCVGQEEAERQFEASRRSPVELRAMQSREIDGEANLVMRGVIATLHDLGYRITKVEPGAGTVTATKLNTVRLSAVVRQRSPGRSVVRANAIVLRPGVETQVDDPEFYQRNFFAPLSVMLNREAFAAPADASVPEALRPESEPDPRRPRVSQSPQDAPR